MVIVLQDEHLVTENFPIKMIRYENNGDDSYKGKILAKFLL